MAGVLTLPDGTTRYLKHVKTREIVAEFDWEAFRAPFGTRPQVAGDGHELPGSITITVEVYSLSDYAELKYDGELVTFQGEPVWAPVTTGPTIQDAAQLVDKITNDAETAVHLRTPLGRWNLRGLQAASERAFGPGYRLDLTWATDGHQWPEGIGE